jgi:tyrosine-protein kinase Etk/Wzc
LEGVLYYFSILLRYRWLIIGITAAATVGIIAFCALSIYLPPDKSPLPNMYSASAVIFVQQGDSSGLSSSIIAALGIVNPSMDSATGFDSGALALMILRSRTFLDKVVEDFQLIRRYKITDQVKSRSRDMLLARTKADYNRTTRAITLSFEDIDPVFARDVVNRMVALLNDWYAQNMGNTQQKEKLLLEEKVKEVKTGLDKLETQMKDFQKKYGVLTVQDLGSSQASALAELRSQLILKEINIKNYSAISSIEDPKLQQLREERQNILDLIDQIQQQGQQTQESSSAQKSLPDLQLEFNQLSVELDIQRKIYNTLSHQYEVLKLTSEPEPAFQVMELAEVPDAKSGPQRMKIVAIVVVLSFFVSAALAFILHSLDQLRKNPKKELIGKEGDR